MDAGERAPAQKLVAACRELADARRLEKPLRVLICGIPNVGKSTLINSMSSRKVAKTGNMPGVTRTSSASSWPTMSSCSTPRMLWPKIEVEEGGYNLAASGAVGRNAMDEEEVTLELLKYLIQHYVPELSARYKLDDIAGLQDWQVLEMIGRKRGAVQSGGKINVQKAAELVLTDFRDGNIGRITLERPEEWLAWEKRARNWPPSAPPSAKPGSRSGTARSPAAVEPESILVRPSAAHWARAFAASKRLAGFAETIAHAPGGKNCVAARCR